MDDGRCYLTPVHYRDLGEKEGHLYDKSVRWSDVLINGVRLEETIDMDNEVPIHEESGYNKTIGEIIVNERKVKGDSHYNENDYSKYEKKWMNRVDKIQLNPVSLPEAKKKGKSHGRYPVKPEKITKEIRGERVHHSNDILHEMIDERTVNPIFQEFISRLPVTPDTHSLSHSPRKLFCPPEHWLIPEIQWDKIWCAMDEIMTGKKRDYHYTKLGEFTGDGVRGPIIYFYDKNEGDLNYNFSPYRDIMDTTYPPYWDNSYY